MEEKINTGDRVRINKGNGDVMDVTVKDAVYYGSELNIYSENNTFVIRTNVGDTVEVLERTSRKPEPGLYTNKGDNSRYVVLPDGREYYTNDAGMFVQVYHEAFWRDLNHNPNWVKDEKL